MSGYFYKGYRLLSVDVSERPARDVSGSDGVYVRATAGPRGADG